MHAICEKHSASDNYLQCQDKIEIEKTIYQSKIRFERRNKQNLADDV